MSHERSRMRDLDECITHIVELDEHLQNIFDCAFGEIESEGLQHLNIVLGRYGLKVVKK